MTELRAWKETPEEWNRLVGTAPDGTVFHTFEWLGHLERAYGVTMRLFSVVDGDRTIGLCPFLIFRRYGLPMVGSPFGGWITTYMGPLAFSTTDRTRVLEAFGAGMRSLRIAYSEAVLPYAVEESLQTWVTEPRQTYVLSLDGTEDELFRRMKHNCRKNINKALRSGVSVKQLSDPSLFSHHLELSKQVYERQNRVSPVSAGLLESFQDMVVPSGNALIFAATMGDRVIGTRIVLLFRDTIYDWEAASDPEYSTVAPNNLLVWAIAKWGLEHGYARYDLCGANIPSIARFKESFGAQLVEYSYVYRVGNRALHWLREFYKTASPRVRSLQFAFRQLVARGTKESGIVPVQAEGETSGEEH